MNNKYLMAFIIPLSLVIASPIYAYEDDDKEYDTTVKIIASIKKIAIVSEIGNEFYPIHLGFTIFQNYEIPIMHTEHNIDSYIQKTLGEIINKKSKQKIYHAISYEKQSINKGYEKDFLGNSIFNIELVSDRFTPLFKKHKLDAIIYFMPSICDDFATKSHAKLKNIGIIRRNTFGVINSYPYMCLSSYLISKEKNKILKRSTFNGFLKPHSNVWDATKKEPDKHDIAESMKFINYLITEKANYLLEYYQLIPETMDSENEE